MTKQEKEKLQNEEVEQQTTQKEVVEETTTEEEKTPEELSAEYLAGWQRCRADYDNLKREMDGKSKEWIDVGVMKVLTGLIPVYNNFSSAVDHIPQDQKSIPWVTGVIYIKQNLEELFNELGLEMIQTVGTTFDDKLHEAVSEEEGEGESGEILKQVSVGFKKGGNVLVPAKVVVRK